MKRVEGFKNLYRNDSGAIVNTNTDAYKAYKAKMQASKDKQQSITELKDEIDELKRLVATLLNK